MEPTPEPHEDFSESVVRADETAFHPEPAAEGERPRLLRQERVGPGFHDEAVGALRRDRASQTLARLDQRQLERSRACARDLHGAVGRRQPRDPAADDDELHGDVPASMRTRSASIATNAGWSLTASARCSVRPAAAARARASTS